jgi:excisionase family DNA binding protein
MNKFLSIQQAAKFLGVSPQTLRRWERNKKISPSHRTQGGQRRYEIAKLQPFDQSNKTTDRPTAAYARVSCQDQKEDLQRQVHMLEIYCSSAIPAREIATH